MDPITSELYYGSVAFLKFPPLKDSFEVVLQIVSCRSCTKKTSIAEEYDHR